MSDFLKSAPFTAGTARLVRGGAVGVDSRGRPEVEDTYALVLADGARPSAGQNGIPDYGDELSGVTGDYAGMVVKGVKFSPPDPLSRVWEARVTYGWPDNHPGRGDSSSSDSSSSSSSSEQLETEGWKRVRYGHRAWQSEFTADADGTPVVNSAGDPFENAPTVDRQLPQITLQADTRRPPLSVIASRNCTVNSSHETVLGVSIGKGQGLIELEAERDYEKGSMWHVTATITINPDGWDLKVLQNGYRYKDGGNYVRFTETTDDGRVVECSSPMPLTASGGDGRGGDPAYATFKMYKESSWSSLSLPSSANR